MRAVLDPNVLVSAALSRGGTPATLLRRWLEGAFELVVSPTLLDELARVLDYPKIRRRITRDEAVELVALLGTRGELVADPDTSAAVTSPDPDDDYLIRLAHAARAVIVSGDSDLLGLADQLPVYAPAAFVTLLDTG